MNNRTDNPSQWAAADDVVKDMAELLRRTPTPTSQMAMMLLAIEHPNRLVLMAMIAATALQRLADAEHRK
jgi:hypothetical protein